MNKIQETFEKWKVEKEVDEHNQSYSFRVGYVKAMCDAINLVKNIDIPDINNSLPIRYCQQCGEPLRRDKHKAWCEHYKQ